MTYTTLRSTFALAVFLTALLPLTTSGQIVDQGNFMVGASLGLSAASSNVESTVDGQPPTKNDANSTTFSVNPKIGYFLVDRFTIGLGMDYTFNRTSEPVSNTDPTLGDDSDFDSDLLFGPFLRYYALASEDTGFFLEVAFGFGSSVDEIIFGGEEQTTSTNVLAASAGPGFTIFNSKGIGLEALVKYNFARSSFDINFRDQTLETITWTNQVDLSLGLVFYFTRVAPAGTPRGGSRDQPEPASSTFY